MNGVGLYWKKSDDIYPLRYWKGKVEITKSSPIDVMNYVLTGRRIWDMDLIENIKIAEIDEQTEINQYTVASMSPHPSREYLKIRYCHQSVFMKNYLRIATANLFIY
jgi:hypothetical protein